MAIFGWYGGHEVPSVPKQEGLPMDADNDTRTVYEDDEGKDPLWLSFGEFHSALSGHFDKGEMFGSWRTFYVLTKILALEYGSCRVRVIGWIV